MIQLNNAFKFSGPARAPAENYATHPLLAKTQSLTKVYALTRDRRRKSAERPCLLGADFVGISSDYTTPLPETIAPRLLVVRRKTGYLDLSPGPGDCVHDIFKFT